ncbi:MAG: hypothetical protein ACXWWD_07415 [Chitinophagaceae bacterium]
MINPCTRSSIFRTSSFADNFIAQMQQSFAADIDVSNNYEKSLLHKYYDHLSPSHHDPLVIDAHCVLAFKAESRKEYFQNLPLAAFFSQLNIEKLFFLDFLKTGMQDFPFQNYTKRNILKQMLGGSLKAQAFSIKVEVVVNVLELFYFSGRYERSAITMIGEGAIPIAMRLCKDGNFHTNFQGIHETQIKKAALATGLTIGDIDLCWDYKI